MTFRPPTAGEEPARIATGSIIATLHKCRAYKIGGEMDGKKQARKIRLAALGFDRQAVFADEERKPATAHKARAEAARLRALADTMEAESNAGARALCVNGGGK